MPTEELPLKQSSDLEELLNVLGPAPVVRTGRSADFLLEMEKPDIEVSCDEENASSSTSIDEGDPATEFIDLYRKGLVSQL